jgi:hypothetical protein
MPATGGFIRHATKFVEPALGAATGWNFCKFVMRSCCYRVFTLIFKGYTMSISVPAEISAAATLVQFWNDSISPAVWITIFLVFIIVINFCGVRLYGEVSLDAIVDHRKTSELTFCIDRSCVRIPKDHDHHWPHNRRACHQSRRWTKPRTPGLQVLARSRRVQQLPRSRFCRGFPCILESPTVGSFQLRQYPSRSHFWGRDKES